MKKCTKCGEVKPLSEFHQQNRHSDKHRSECKVCHNAFMTQINEQNRRQLNQIKADSGCMKCGERRPFVLDFHHKDRATKDKKIAKLLVHSSSKKMMEEIQKCVILCSNCHREFHYYEQKEGLTWDAYLKQ